MSRNRLFCGPFTSGTQATLMQELERIGLRPSDGDAAIQCRADPSGGLRLEAQGAGVRGYLLAEDGEEAELQDIKRLILTCCPAQREITFVGSALIAEETLLVTSSRATHDGRTVTWSSLRSVMRPSDVRTLRDEVGLEITGRARP
ncbi:hypothetical protein [Tabrizicola sp.]|uniref:hypothetical protein n=1 Tax=Tabrizicola sp. TaxID=2005166 RepID=UPI0035AEFE68